MVLSCAIRDMCTNKGNNIVVYKTIMAYSIWHGKDKRKESIKKVPVQVKGKQSDGFSLDTIKYPVTVVDLENYFNDGGIVSLSFILVKMEEIQKYIILVCFR